MFTLSAVLTDSTFLNWCDYLKYTQLNKKQIG